MYLYKYQEVQYFVNEKDYVVFRIIPETWHKYPVHYETRWSN